MTWVQITLDSFRSMWEGFLGFLPSLLGAIIIFLIGWAIAVGLQKLIEQIIKSLRIDQVLLKAKVSQQLERAGMKINVGLWLGLLVKWFLMFVFLMAAVDILGLNEVTSFLKSVILYLPNVIVAVIILIVAVWVANLVDRLIRASLAAGSIRGSFAAALARWSIIIFAIFAALIQVGIAPTLLQTLVTGLIAMLAIAGGLAFGLGGKEQAAEFLQKLRQEIRE